MFTWTSGHRTYQIQVPDSGKARVHEHDDRMAAPTRRACYKCGNVGHYAGRTVDSRDQGLYLALT